MDTPDTFPAQVVHGSQPSGLDVLGGIAIVQAWPELCRNGSSGTECVAAGSSMEGLK